MILRIAVLIPLFLYGAAIIALTYALFRKNGRGNGYPAAGGGLPGVSVIIPFRNEERNLPALLESLEKQSYNGVIEIIFVNDGSDDNGVDIIKKYLNHNGGSGAGTVNGHIQGNEAISVKIIDLRLSGSVKLTSKQQALDLGAAESSQPLMLFTDADMVLAPDWAENLVRSQIASGADLVFGHTSIITGKNVTADKYIGVKPKTSVFALFEAYQLEFLFAFAYAFSKLNLTGSCMGNNLLVVKDTYVKCGGQRGVGYNIVEDRALLELLRKKGFLTAAAEPFHVTAKTWPSRSLKQFFNQTARWVRGGMRMGGGLFAAGMLLLVQNLAVCLTVTAGAALLLTGRGILTVLKLAAAPAIINFLLTWIFTAAAFRKTAAPTARLLYPAYYIFMMAETAITALSLIFNRKIEWKNRKLGGT